MDGDLVLQLNDENDYSDVVGNTHGLYPSKIKGRGLVKFKEIYEFQSAKYKNNESKTIIPADISEEDSFRIREIAVKSFQILNLHGYSRIDFFLTSDHQVILNEINTIPGFTEISMYPKLWEATGVSYSDLLDTLIVENIKK